MNMGKMSAKDIVKLIEYSIVNWHNENENRDENYIIVTEDIRKIRPLNHHRDDLNKVVEELVITNTEMWHEEDKVRSDVDITVLKAIRNINPLNQHRNDLIEEIDEILIDQAKGGK